MANNYIVNSSDLTSVADAIREKTGTSDPLVFPDGFVEALGGISGGGGGNTDAEDGIITRTITECSNDRVTSVGDDAFNNCTNLTKVDFPNVTSVGKYAFEDCTNLTRADLLNATSIANSAFAYCKSFTALILRSNSMCTLGNSNAFSNCLHFNGTLNTIYNPTGAKDGYIYVPRALIENYKVATNWSTYATQFRALEDYTVDGTITGELDPNKI